MAENELIVTAGLDFKTSEGLIISQLNTIQDEYNKKGGMQIHCKISDESLKAIQNSLGNLTKTLNVDVNVQNIQQNISNAIKNQKVEVDITTKINKSTLQKQAKEMEEILQLFDRGGKQSGRAELASLLEEYQKAFKAENYEGTVNALNKIITFTREHQRTVEVTNEELKAQQERVQGVLKDMQKLYITTEQLEAVQRELTGSKRNVQGLTTEAENFLNNYLGKKKWSDDPSEFTNVATHYWSTFVDSVNNIIHGSGNKYMELLNEGDIVEGLRNFVDFMGKSTDATNAYMRSNALTAEQWADSVGSAITKVTGTNLAEVANWGWTDILSDETVEHTEQNAQKMAQAYSTVQAAKDLYKDDKSVKSVTSDWVFDANKNITGFTINVNKLNGEVERLNHTITETGEVKFLGGSGSDKGVEKQAETMIKFVNEYTAKLNSLKAKVGEQFAPNITATLGDDMQKTTVTFDSFEKKLAELLKGNGNIGELRSEFTALDGVVKSLGAQLRGSDTSLNQFTNAINNARKFDNDLKALEVDYNNLNEKQRESETLTKSLADAQKKLAVLRNTQQTEGYTEKWIDQYHQVSIALTQLTADLKLAKKLEQQDTSSAAHKQAAALKEISDAYREITSLSNKISSPSTKSEYKAELERQLAVQNDIVNKTILRAQEEGLINKEFREQIQLYEQIQQNSLLAAQAKQRDADITREETEATKQLAEQTKYVKNALKELDSLKTASSYKNAGGVNANIIRDSLTSLGLSTKSSDIGSLKNLFNQMLGKIDKATTISDIQAIEKELGNLKSMFDETVKSTNAETEAAKQMSDALSKIDSAIGKMQNINKQLITGNLTQGEIESKKKEFQNQNLILLQEKERLATAGLLTQQIDKRIKQLGEESNEIARQLGADKQRAEAEKEAEKIAKKEEEDARKILAIYKEIAAQNKILANPNSTETQIRQATEKADREREALALMYDELGVQTMLNGKRGEAIVQGEQLAADAVNIAREQQQAAQAKKDETEAEKAYKKELQDVNKILKDNIAALEKFNNSSAAKNNKNNPLVASQTGLNAGYIAQLQGLQESLANDKSATNVARVRERINELSNTLRDAKFNSEALQQSLTDTNAEATLESKIKNLKNQVDIFANSNRRATESLKQMRNGMTFADEWRRIVSEIKGGKLDNNAIRRLSEDLRNFKGEAQSAGLTVNRFFQSMGSQLRMVAQRWLSLYAIIGRITSAFNDLKSVDKILTEIAKSSDVARDSLESLGNAAFDAANKYGRSVTDYLYGVQEFSRAGFRGEQLTGLTEVSLLAQSAGDIETDLANSYVIATNAAYGFAGSQEKLGEVLDRQNYVTNNYALNMTDLANATKIAASQAAQSGVDIDQMTAALATMISTTQQGGEIAARSLRGILMNIQQVKGEVGDGEEDVTAESLTKYEKAAKDLGVALKEVKDGVTVLRDPMAVLNDLAEAFNKEADDSIKKANLINAIGGKFYLVA